MVSVHRGDLGRLSLIASGGAGTVYNVEKSPRGMGPVAYKELKPSLKPAEMAAAIESIRKAVAFRDSLSAADRDDLDSFTVWPSALVHHGTAPVGLLMPLLGRAFFVDTTPADQPPGREVFELAWLSAKESQRLRAGVDITKAGAVLTRLTLLAHLVYAIGRLHRLGVVYGDISLKNAALALDPPRIKLLDCDATALLTDGSRQQAHSPFFMPPELKNRPGALQDQRSDVYKLGLCLIRGLQQGAGVTQSRNPAGLATVFEAEGVALVARAVSDDPDARPNAKELFRFLERTIARRTSPPVIRAVAVDRSAVVQGQSVTVTWDVANASVLELVTPEGSTLSLGPPGTHPRGFRFQPHASGEVLLIARNDYSSASAVAGVVDFVKLPDFTVDVGWLPRPQVPTLQPVSVSPVLPLQPDAMTAVPAVPEVTLPTTDRIVDTLASAWDSRLPTELVGEAVVTAGVAVQRSIDLTTERVVHLMDGAEGPTLATARRRVDDAMDALAKSLAQHVPGTGTGGQP